MPEFIVNQGNSSIEWHPEGNVLAAGGAGRQVKQLDLRTGKLTRTFGDKEFGISLSMIERFLFTQHYLVSLWSLDWSSCGRYLAVSFSNKVNVFDLAAEKQIYQGVTIDESISIPLLTYEL